MKRRWSADSSTKLTTAEQPVVSGGETEQARVVDPHRDLGRQILQVVAGQPELGEDHETGPGGAGLGQELVVACEVLLEQAEPRRELGKGDPERLHDPSLMRGRPSGSGRDPG